MSPKPLPIALFIILQIAIGAISFIFIRNPNYWMTQCNRFTHFTFGWQWNKQYRWRIFRAWAIFIFAMDLIVFSLLAIAVLIQWSA